MFVNCEQIVMKNLIREKVKSVQMKNKTTDTTNDTSDLFCIFSVQEDDETIK